ncbi:hypothetical protein ERO13_A10G198866v2 [Gossypium hirsutum]|uniref:Uncharacterized protein n=1 Tax=Gossypium mustelinum TaxID=34275 RepID=A0A5D2XQ20_GOSMU|nr:hypothetical protein ERO13_A10G198866v2 [Gossypium hirsutum]TYJ15959.1 hypothetical protein E1A91_A10G217900v1 [Gossypium mustelinum]
MYSIDHCYCATTVIICCCILGDRHLMLLKALRRGQIYLKEIVHRGLNKILLLIFNSVQLQVFVAR